MAAACCGAQDQDPPPPEDDPAVPLQAPTEFRPGMSIVKNKDGQWVEMPNFRLEDYLRLLLREQQDVMPNEEPSFRLERVDVAAVVNGNIAELSVEVQLRITSERPVRIPLRLGQVALRSPPSELDHKGQGKARLEYEPTLREYVCVLEGPEDSEHRISFRAVRGVSGEGDAQQLDLALPLAPTTLTLTVPQTPIEPRVSRDSSLVITSTQTEGRKNTKLTLEGTGGDVRISWRATEGPAAAPLLTAQTAIDIRVKDRQDVTAAAVVTVNSYGAPVREFDIRLPLGMRLLTPLEQPGLKVQTLPGEQPQGAGDLVRVTLEEATSEPVRVELLAALASGSDVGRFEALGFEVQDVVSQQGTVMVTADKGWDARPVKVVAANRVSPPPEASAGTWKYEFAGPPHSLEVQVVPAKARLHIEPVYVVQVVRGQIGLRASLHCTLQGGAEPPVSLAINLPGWQVRDVSGEQVVARDQLKLNKVSPLEISLTPPDQPRQSFTVEVTAAQPLAPGAEELQFELPHPVNPIDTTVTTGVAQLVVASADDIEVTPVSQQLTGLEIDSRRGADVTGLPAPQQEPHVYRVLLSEAPAQFAGRLVYHDQTIVADVRSQLNVSQSRVDVTQSMRHRISYVPATHLLLEVAAELVDPAARLAVELDGEPLNVQPVEHPSSNGAAALRVELPSRTIGECLLRLSFSVPTFEAKTSSRAPLVVPLAQPLSADSVSRHRLEVVAGEDVGVQVKQDPWRPDPAAPDNDIYLADDGASSVSLWLSSQDQLVEATVVTQTWLQTWLQEHLRRDRVAFRVRTNQQRLQIELPDDAAADPASLRVAVNRRQVTPEVDSASRTVTVELPSSPQEHVLELWYSFSTRTNWLGSRTIQPPRIVGAGGLGRTFWELLVPRSHQLVQGPSQLAADMNWTWGRQGPVSLPSQNQESLERWIGASHQEPVPAGLRPFLYTTFGQLPEMSIRTLPTNWVVLTVAGAALLLGWGLLHWRTLRSPSALLLLGVLVVTAAATWPHVAWLVAQAAALGLALMAFGQLLRVSLATASTPWRGSSRQLDTTHSLRPALLESATLGSGSPSSHGSTASVAAPSIPAPEPKP